MSCWTTNISQLTGNVWSRSVLHMTDYRQYYDLNRQACCCLDAAGFSQCGFGVTESQLIRPSHSSSTLSFFLSSTISAMRSHRLSHLSLISVCRPTCVSQQPPRRILLGRRSSFFKFSSTLEKSVATLEIKVTHKKALQSVHFSWK